MTHSASENLGHAVVVVAWVFASFAIGVVAARFYACLRILHKVSIDDYIILLTLFLGIGNSICLTISYSWGLGTHIEFLVDDPLRILYTIKYVYICELFSIMCPGFGRISYAFLLLRLIPPSKSRRRFLWAIIWIQFVVDIGTVIISFSQCRPMEGFWNTAADADCWPPYVQQYVGFVQGSICSVVDLTLAAFPASLFWNLNMEWKQKVSLSVMMGLGVFAMIASIIKTVHLKAITATNDLTYAMAELAIWWTLEAYLVLLAVSIPSLRSLKVKTTRSQRSHSHSRELSSFQSWKRGRAGQQENSGALGPFDGYTVINEITRDDTRDRGVKTSYPRAIHSRERIGGDGVIRKDVTVMVTYGTPVTSKAAKSDNA
ncbi:integral membrane protein [Hypoxylon cercidicola]|nr:integral membrane protein [Hypoxylon cercidicola]